MLPITFHETKTFQPSIINWSNRYRGNAARTQINPNNTSVTLIPSQTGPGKIPNPKGNNEYHPPKKQIAVRALIIIIFAYSPRKNNAKPIEEYSTL